MCARIITQKVKVVILASQINFGKVAVLVVGISYEKGLHRPQYTAAKKGLGFRM